MRVLTWNLFHGRSHPSTGRSMRPEFFATLAGWEWDIAMLQEVPPWWPEPMAAACGAQFRSALTSRNLLRPVRRALWCRFPDVIRSGQGGCNAILVRGDEIVDHRRARLRRLPERRTVHGVALAGGAWIVNMHATVTRSDPEQRDLRRALEVARAWAGAAPLVFGGDLNQTRPAIDGLTHVAAHHVDHLYTRGLAPAGPAVRPQHGTLSDHDPVVVELTAAAAGKGGAAAGVL